MPHFSRPLREVGFRKRRHRRICELIKSERGPTSVLEPALSKPCESKVVERPRPNQLGVSHLREPHAERDVIPNRAAKPGEEPAFPGELRHGGVPHKRHGW